MRKTNTQLTGKITANSQVYNVSFTHKPFITTQVFNLHGVFAITVFTILVILMLITLFGVCK